jgi:hypothetical protein
VRGDFGVHNRQGQAGSLFLITDFIENIAAGQGRGSDHLLTSSPKRRLNFALRARSGTSGSPESNHSFAGVPD